MRPANSTPRKGAPRARISSSTGTNTSARSRSSSAVGTPWSSSRGATAPMPPVFGPGRRRETLVVAGRAEEHGRRGRRTGRTPRAPRRAGDLRRRRCGWRRRSAALLPSPSSARTASTASWRRRQTMTPLPAHRPSALTTTPRPARVRLDEGARVVAVLGHDEVRASRTPAAAHTDFMKALLPSSVPPPARVRRRGCRLA